MRFQTRLLMHKPTNLSGTQRFSHMQLTAADAENRLFYSYNWLQCFENNSANFCKEDVNFSKWWTSIIYYYESTIIPSALKLLFFVCFYRLFEYENCDYSAIVQVWVNQDQPLQVTCNCTQEISSFLEIPSQNLKNENLQNIYLVKVKRWGWKTTAQTRCPHEPLEGEIIALYLNISALQHTYEWTSVNPSMWSNSFIVHIFLFYNSLIMINQAWFPSQRFQIGLFLWAFLAGVCWLHVLPMSAWVLSSN